jgi:hypothetical protein
LLCIKKIQEYIYYEGEKIMGQGPEQGAQKANVVTFAESIVAGTLPKALNTFFKSNEHITMEDIGRIVQENSVAVKNYIENLNITNKAQVHQVATFAFDYIRDHFDDAFSNVDSHDKEDAFAILNETKEDILAEARARQTSAMPAAQADQPIAPAQQKDEPTAQEKRARRNEIKNTLNAFKKEALAVLIAELSEQDPKRVILDPKEKKQLELSRGFHPEIGNKTLEIGFRNVMAHDEEIHARYEKFMNKAGEEGEDLLHQVSKSFIVMTERDYKDYYEPKTLLHRILGMPGRIPGPARVFEKANDEIERYKALIDRVVNAKEAGYARFYEESKGIIEEQLELSQEDGGTGYGLLAQVEHEARTLEKNSFFKFTEWRDDKKATNKVRQKELGLFDQQKYTNIGVFEEAEKDYRKRFEKFKSQIRAKAYASVGIRNRLGYSAARNWGKVVFALLLTSYLTVGRVAIPQNNTFNPKNIGMLWDMAFSDNDTAQIKRQSRKTPPKKDPVRKNTPDTSAERGAPATSAPATGPTNSSETTAEAQPEKTVDPNIVDGGERTAVIPDISGWKNAVTFKEKLNALGGEKRYTNGDFDEKNQNMTMSLTLTFNKEAGELTLTTGNNVSTTFEPELTEQKIKKIELEVGSTHIEEHMGKLCLRTSFKLTSGYTTYPGDIYHDPQDKTFPVVDLIIK